MKRDVRNKEYTIRKVTYYILSTFKHKNFYLSKYHTIKEYFLHYLKNK